MMFNLPWRGTTFIFLVLTSSAVSMLCLLLHLVIFVATPNLIKLPSMDLASLCVSLLLLYSTFITDVLLEQQSKELAIVMHYALLTSFCWMLIISFDVWRIIRLSCSCIPLSSGPKWRRFSVYSAFGWLTPMLIVISAVIVDQSDLSSSYSNFKPTYSNNGLWTNNAEAFIVFVVIPFVAVMILNVVFYSWGSFFIYSTKKEVINVSNSRLDFWIFLRLAVITGLTWITGFIAAFVKSEVVWYMFLTLNILQGLFIFVAFSCRKKVWKELSKSLYR